MADAFSIERAGERQAAVATRLTRREDASEVSPAGDAFSTGSLFIFWVSVVVDRIACFLGVARHRWMQGSDAS